MSDIDWLIVEAFADLSVRYGGQDDSRSAPAHRGSVRRTVQAVSQESRARVVALWNEVLGDLEQLGALGDDWDCEGGVAPDRAALAQARAIARRLPASEIHVWSASVHSDGRIILQRSAGANEDEMLISGDGTVVHWSVRQSVYVGTRTMHVDEVFGVLGAN